MKCRTAERLMLRSKDSVLLPSAQGSLEAHLRQCPRCRQVDEEYRELFRCLRPVESRGPSVFAWERLRAGIAEREAAALGPHYEQWALKAIPAAIVLALLIASASFLFKTPSPSSVSASEELLLRNTNPLVEARTILDQKKLEDKGLMLLFASNEAGLRERK
jgi:predicted anti-sigma-YlaC factor YlaD